jgi:sporulation protein YlmC with PRC-barrel domain
MKRNLLIAMTSVSVLLGAMSASLGQVAGSTPLGIAVTELSEVTTGWSAKRQILGQTIYNDKDEKVGKVDDIIVAPDKAISYAIVGAGGFLGVGKHDVAIPVNQFKAEDEKLVLAGASKDVLKAMPEFEYAH